MPTLEFKGKQFVYSHHLSVPFRELKVNAKKSLLASTVGGSARNDVYPAYGRHLERRPGKSRRCLGLLR